MIHRDTENVRAPAGRVELDGVLGVPEGASGIVLFAHGSGSGRLSPRNSRVAAALRKAGMATLLFDLLTEEEAAERANVFDIPLLASRLGAMTSWTRSHPTTAGLPVAYFGASTGGGAALLAAANDAEIAAVVSRGGRPDLAGDALARVMAPTLLVVGGNDTFVIALNRDAYRQLRCSKQFAIVPGAGHLFEEPGTLDDVIGLASSWFRRHFVPARVRRAG